MLVLGLAIVSLAFAVFLVGEVVTAPTRERVGSIRRAANYGASRSGPMFGITQGSFRERAVAPMKTGVARAVLRMNPKASLDSVNRKLLGAGMGRRVSPTGFLASKGLLAGGGVLAGIFVGAMAFSPKASLFVALVLGAIGFFVPDLFVAMKARSRREQIRAELPDALDLLAVSVEAGMGFDGAVAKVTEHMHGPLVEEFALALSEMRIGESRENALKKMVERVDAPELAAFVRAIIQADQLGISLGRILRVQAADTRLRRQAAAEEKAMKAPIKMLFPTALFIFPSMFLVILGPALLNLSRVF
jgi:tight adherence protein C